MRAVAKRMIAVYGISAHMKITGRMSSLQVRDEILASSAMVLPSFAKGLPVVIMEAVALKRSVISTYVAGIRELVIDGKNGWLMLAGFVLDLTDATKAMFSTRHQHLIEVGEAAYNKVRQRHDIDAEASKQAFLFLESVK